MPIFSLSGQLIPIRRAAQKSNCSQHNLFKMVQIVGSIARHSEQLRSVSISDIVCIFCPKLSGTPLLNALREVESRFRVWFTTFICIL